ncbi:elongation factor P [Haliovirga abyssi]|uniref:Elongation factor P n=1 Tax=Haliovirga abyssi TaxID=2996794 RepID=A0AAU9DI47_9FUSO|nr:elongation factor P [Haliovirga abyssi]BDU50429.1 elongation factor P [Haliovirga abyssi]
MKNAKEIRAGNIIKIGNDVFIVQKAEFSKSGRSSAVVKFKFKNLLTNAKSETVLKAADKVDDIILDKQKMVYIYENGGQYAFQNQETWEELNLTKEDLGDALKYLEENMEILVVFYEGRAVGIEMPTTLDREVVYTEPGLKGDTTGRALKSAELSTGHEIMVPLFINQGDIIRIDTRTDEYLERAK